MNGSFEFDDCECDSADYADDFDRITRRISDMLSFCDTLNVLVGMQVQIVSTQKKLGNATDDEESINMAQNPLSIVI